MKLFRTNFLNTLLQGSRVKSTGAKFICCLFMLLFSSVQIFAQAPTLELRIMNLRHDPLVTAHGAIIFDIEMRAGANYIGSNLPLISTEIFVDYNLQPGVLLSTGFMSGAAPVPNPHGIGTVIVQPYPYTFIKTNSIRIYLTRNYPLAPNQNKNNFTQAWTKVTTITIPLLV